jgi:hypothetical protein
MRKLATIQIIDSITPIENADKIEVAHILGWECVVKKDEFKIGQKVIYCEVDSVMPEKPEYEFLRERKFRIRTIKLRGQVSQGLVLPLSVLSDTKGALARYAYSDVGTDVTEILGITKYLTPTEQSEIQKQEERIKFEKNKLKKFFMRYSWFRKLFLTRSQKEGFPYWVQKTDEERIQNMPQVLQQFEDRIVTITEKIDYQSVTFTGQLIPKYTGFLGRIIKTKTYKFVVCSRNLTNNDKNSLYWKIAKLYNVEEILKKFPNLTIQGEQGDTKVQGNKYGISKPQMWVFNIFDHNRKYFFNQREIDDFCSQCGLVSVPTLHKCKLSDFATSVTEIVEKSKGKSVINPNIHREGIVIRCVENGQKLLSFKVINPDFLLKYQD